MRRVLIVEDEDLMRLALMEEMTVTEQHCYVAGAPTYEIARELLSEQKFDIVITDPSLPGYDSMDVVDRRKIITGLVEGAREAVHIILSSHWTKDEADFCRSAGAAAYASKAGFAAGTLGKLLCDIAKGGFSERIHCDLPMVDFKFSGLTPRELKVIGMMLRRPRGVKRREIFALMSEQLGIELESAEKYFKSARGKLQKQGPLPSGL